jgi:hypothetical protein
MRNQQNQERRGNRAQQGGVRRFERNDDRQPRRGPAGQVPNQAHKQHPIKRDHPGKFKGQRRNEKRGPKLAPEAEKDEMDRQLRDYWIGEKGIKTDGGTW